MAIAFDSSELAKTQATSSTWSHTCTGDDRLLVVSVAVGGGATVTSIKYNSVDMTLINVIAGGGASFDNVYLYQLVAPSTGANNVVVNISSSQFLYTMSSSYTGVEQSNPIDVDNTTSLTGTTITGTLTTTIDNDWLVGAAWKVTHISNITWTAGANTTEREEEPTNGWMTFIDTNSAQTPTGSKSITTTASASHSLVMNFAAISPVQVSVTTRKIKISGTFQDKPIKTKVAGTFVDKPIKIKVGGTFQ